MFARTERLTLRPAWPEEAPALMAVGHEPLARLLTRGLPASDSAGSRIAAPRGAYEPRFVIEAHEAERPTLIGAIGLYEEVNGTDLAFWLTPPARGRGYATEAGRAVIDMARHALPLRRLRARHCMKDAASARVVAKLGFRPAGHEAAPAPSTFGGMVELLYDLDVSVRTPSLSLAA